MRATLKRSWIVLLSLSALTVLFGALAFEFLSRSSAAKPLQFVPLLPCRISDTRNPASVLGGPFIAGGTSRRIPVRSGKCGVPSTAVAYSLNITVSPRKGFLGYLTLWPTGQARPDVSTSNSLDGTVQTNTAIIPSGAGGAINAFALNDTDLVVDINGYFARPDVGTLQFYWLAPCRVLDTRGPIGISGGPSIAGGRSRSFPMLSDKCGVPSTAVAYAMNVTAIPQDVPGYLTVWPTGKAIPIVSNLGSGRGPALIIVAAGDGGAVSFYANTPADLIVDINGYFAPPSPGGLNFHAVGPCRVVDTRRSNDPSGPIVGNTTKEFSLRGSCGLPAAAVYSLNITTAEWPNGPVVANAALVRTDASGGGIYLHMTNTAHVIIDVSGYFVR